MRVAVAVEEAREADLADQSGIEFVHQLCSYLPLIRLLTGLLPNVESTARTAA